MAAEALLELVGVGKRFGSTTVLHDVDMTVRRGQIHGLIGQNGAGKSTMVKILAGVYPDHLGEVRLEGRRVKLATPRQARVEGIAVIYQEFSIVGTMTVAENLLLGREPGVLRYSARATRERAERLLAEVGVDVGAPVTALVSQLSPALKQRIEIARALAQNAKVLVMDEPTARLSGGERDWLFATMRALAARGVGIVFISHFLEEVLGVTDWLTILRNGRVVESADSATLSLARMTELMLGEELQSSLASQTQRGADEEARPVLLEAVALSVAPRLHDVDLTLHAGEIIGLAGLVGSGRTRLCRALAGVDTPTAGEVRLHGASVRLRTPHRALTRGIALIPEDRKTQGLALVLPIRENVALMALQRGLGRDGFVGGRSVKALAEESVRTLEVSPANIEAPVGTLSGGNQQKVLMGKALAAHPEVLIVDQPTAGVDVGTKAHLHRTLREVAEAGAGILVASDDLDELYALSDRLVVMRGGGILWQGPPGELPREVLLQWISTGRTDSAETPGAAAAS